jgi:hypothetical protein
MAALSQDNGTPVRLTAERLEFIRRRHEQPSTLVPGICRR